MGELLNLSDDAKTKAEAESEYKAAVAENTLDEKAQTRLGDLSSHKGDSAQPLQYYKTALRLQPQDAEANLGLAKTLIARNEQAKALPILERAVQLVPPGSVRIQSSTLDKLPNIAYETPGGKYVVIVANISGTAQDLSNSLSWREHCLYSERRRGCNLCVVEG